MASYKGDPNAQDPSVLSDGMRGSCLCGSIEITITKPNLFPKSGHMCHCVNCRKASGCVASNNMVLQQDQVQIKDPKKLLKTYNDSNKGSGLTTPRSFCSNCGRYLRPKFVEVYLDDFVDYVLPLGIFPRIPEPVFELFTAHKHDWQPKLSGTKKFKFMTSSGEVDK